MKNIQITVMPQAKILEGTTEESIMQILERNEIFMDAPCGGNGTCGKCTALICGETTPASRTEKALLGADFDAGYRLCCQTKPLGDLTVTLPQQGDMEIQTQGTMKENLHLNPGVQVRFAKVAVSSLEDQTDDEAQVLEAFGMEEMNLCVLRDLPNLLRESAYALYAVTEERKIIALSLEKPGIVGMAVDIGTTTVVAYFYDLESGSLLDIQSGMNEQRSFGADVISRINAAIEDDSAIGKLQQLIVNQLNEMCEAFSRKTGRMHREIVSCVIAGNTTMEHLFMGVDPRCIAAAPFIPATLFGNRVTAAETGLMTHPLASVFIVKSVASYVGGDITAGMLACGILEETRPCLYIDIGTNGEMGIWANGKMICCSTAAGPAFEGAHIRYGTGGVPGAIRKVWLREDHTLAFETIQNAPPVGICGSGLIDLVALLLQEGVIDETGRLLDADEIDSLLGICVLEREGETVFRIVGDIVLTAQDIREVQLAKAAIAAGIETLLHEADLSLEEIEKLFLAGGFGNNIDPGSAVRIGLLPRMDLNRMIPVGNAAGSGCVQMLLSRESNRELEAICQKSTYLELSGNRFFQDAYIEQMMF